MKKISLSILSVAMLLTIATSCSTTSRTGYAAPFAYTEVHPDEIKAELDFDLNNKKSGKASASYLFGFLKVGGDNKYAEVKGSETNSGVFGSKVAKVKSAAIYNALEGGGSDMLIAPQYNVHSTSFLLGLFKKYNVEVKGYDAKIKNLYQVK